MNIWAIRGELDYDNLPHDSFTPYLNPMLVFS